MDEKQMMEMLDLIKGELSPEQIEKINQAGKMLNPDNLKPEHVISTLKKFGVNLDALQKQARKARGRINANKPKKVKIGRNDPCPCGTEKKYKKCCFGK